jgi:hypothetical protein
MTNTEKVRGATLVQEVSHNWLTATAMVEAVMGMELRMGDEFGGRMI